MVTLDAIQARFCDGTDVRAKKKKKKKQRHLGVGGSAKSVLKNTESGPPPERYFLVEGELDSGFLNFRAFLFNDMLLLATPQDVDGPYFSAKSVPLWYHGLSMVRDAEVTAMPDGLSFMIKGGDGRTIFRGAPKSWPPLETWIALLRRCLDGTPPAPEDVIEEIEMLASSQQSNDTEEADDGLPPFEGSKEEERGGEGEEWRDEQVDGIGGVLLKSPTKERAQAPSRMERRHSGRASRRHSAITVEELELTDEQKATRSSRKGSLDLPSQVPTLLSGIMERKARSRTSSPTTTQPHCSGGSDRGKVTLPTSNSTTTTTTPITTTSSSTERGAMSLGFGAMRAEVEHLSCAQRSLERLCRVLRQCSRRMAVQAPAALTMLLDYELGGAANLRFFKRVLAVSRMQSVMLTDPGFRRALVHDCVAGDEHISRIHFLDTAQPLAGNWLHDMHSADEDVRNNMSLVAQYWSARSLLGLHAALTLTSKQGESSDLRFQQSVLAQHELCRLLLGGSVPLARGAARDEEDWPLTIPTEYHTLRPVVARCLLERVVGYDQNPESSSVDMGLDEGTLGFQRINIGGFVRGDQSFGFERPNMTMRYVSALAVLFQCMTDTPTIDALSVDTMIEIRDLFCDTDVDAAGLGRKATEHRGGTQIKKTRESIVCNLSLLVAESEGNWPLWFVSVMVRSAGSVRASMRTDDQMFTSSSRYLGNLAEGSNAGGALHELSCDMLASVMAQVLVDQIGSTGRNVPAHDRFSFGRALSLACDAIAFSYSREEHGQPIMFPSGKECMRRFLTRLVSLVSHSVSTVLQKNSPGGRSNFSSERRMVWRTIPDFSCKHWAGFYDMLVFVESFVLTSYWNTNALLSSDDNFGKSGTNVSFLSTSDAVPFGYFRTQVCKVQSQKQPAAEHGLGDSTIGIHLALGAKPSVCLDSPLVSNMIGVLKSLQHAHRRFEEDSGQMRHLPEYSALNHFGQSLSMFESIADLMRSVELHLNDSRSPNFVPYKIDTKKENMLDDQIFATAVCCEPRLRNISLQENDSGMSSSLSSSSLSRGGRGSGLGLIGALTALQIARGLATSIEHVTHKDTYLGALPTPTSASARVSPVPFRGDAASPGSLTQSRDTSHGSVYARRLTSILNMDAGALREALRIKTNTRLAAATSHHGMQGISEREHCSSGGNLPESMSKRERLEVELLRLKTQVNERMEMKHKITALNEEARLAKQRTAQLRQKAKQEDEDYRAWAAKVAKDVYLLQSQSERMATAKSDAMSPSSTYLPPLSLATSQVKDRLLDELCSKPHSAERRPTSPVFFAVDTSDTLARRIPHTGRAIAVRGRRASLEAYHTDWQERWDEREEDYTHRMNAAQRAHRDKMQTVLMEQGHKQKKSQNVNLSGENETVVLLRNQVNAASDALQQIRLENAEGSGEAVVQSARKHAEDVQELVKTRQEWERRGMQVHRSVLAELEVEREKMQSDALDNLSALGEHFQTKAKSILDTQVRIFLGKNRHVSLSLSLSLSLSSLLSLPTTLNTHPLVPLGCFFSNFEFLFPQARIDRNPAFAWSPDWLTTKMRAHYEVREAELFKDSVKIHDDNMRITLASWEDRFEKLTTFLKLKYDAYREHLELNEADVDVLDEADLAMPDFASVKSNAKNSDMGKDSNDEDVHEFLEDDVTGVVVEAAKDDDEVKLLKKGLGQKFWQLLRQEKSQWRQTCSLGSDERLQHMADVHSLSLQQSQRQLKDAIMEGKLVHARWTKVLRENGQRQLQAVKALTEKVSLHNRMPLTNIFHTDSLSLSLSLSLSYP